MEIKRSVGVLVLAGAGAGVLAARPADWIAVLAIVVALLGIGMYLKGMPSGHYVGIFEARFRPVVTRMVSDELYSKDQLPRERLRIVVPVAQLTGRLKDLLCTIPADVELELCVTGLWTQFNETKLWRKLLGNLETKIQQHFRSVILSITRWQSPLMTVEADDRGILVLVPLEPSGAVAVFLHSSDGSVSSALQDMHDAVFLQSVAVEHLVEPLED